MPEDQQLRRIHLILAAMMDPEGVQHWWNLYIPQYDATPQMLVDQGRIEIAASCVHDFMSSDLRLIGD